MVLPIIFVLFISSSTALECYKSHSSVEKCSDTLASFFQPTCFNRTETLEDGRTRHTFGCADWKMKTIPGRMHGGAYCFNPDGTPFLGNGKLCICLTDKCNHHPHHYRKPNHRKNFADFYLSSSTAYGSYLLLLLIIAAIN